MKKTVEAMTEAKVREIHLSNSIMAYTHDELHRADRWLKQYALDKLEAKLEQAKVSKPVIGYVMLMATCHYGSIETDQFLQKLRCYPKWCS